MSFLAPLFLLGALALALPVVFHLVRRTSQAKIPFSSLMFLLPTPPRVTRRSRLEHILLLCLRCLVLALLSLGFARPFIQRAISTPPASQPGKWMLVLVDISASMRRESLWPDALAKLRSVLDRTTLSDQVAVFAFDRQLRPIVSFEQWNDMAPGERASLTAQRLGSLTPTWSATDLGGALTAAAEALENAANRAQSVSSPAARQIILISDLQEGSRLDGLQGYEWPRGLELVSRPVAARRPSNAGLQWMAEPDESASALPAAPVRIRVANSSDSQREQFQLRWAPDAAPGILRGETLSAYVPPGQSRVVATTNTVTDGTGERLQLTGDDQDFDNLIYLVSSPPETISVFFAGTDGETDPAGALYYLKRALQDTRRQRVQVAVLAPGAPPAPLEAGRPSLWVIARGAVPSQAKAIREQAAAAGGTVLLVMDSSAMALILGDLLGNQPAPADEATATGYAMLGQIDFEHPLFAPFADPRFSDFTKIHFWKHRRLNLDGLAQARVLARFDNGDPAWVQIPLGRGSVLVLTSSWQPADSQFALSSKFVPLLYSLLDQSRGLPPPPVQYWVDDPVSLASWRASGPVRIRKPDGTVAELAAGERVFTQTQQRGMYTVLSPQPTQRFVVNLALAESRTAPMPIETLARLGVPLRSPGLESEAPFKEAAQQRAALERESQQKLWRWLVLAAIAALLLETLLAGWLTRRPAAQSPALV